MGNKNKNTEITRKEAIRKMGKYAAFTAVGTFAVLNPLQAQNSSAPLDPLSSKTDNSNNEVISNDTSEDASSKYESRVGTSQVKNNF